MIKKEIEKFIQEAIDSLKKENIFDITSEKTPIIVSVPSNLAYGDYSTNIALILAKKNNKKAEKVAEMTVLQLKKIKDIDNYFENIQVVNAFINFTISQKILLNNLEEILKKQENFAKKEKIKKTIVVDYSSPNIAKPFGIGHLRSTIIGQAIYNIYKFLGWNVIGINHLGDWGTQFGKLIVAIRMWWEKDLEELTIQDLEKLYIKFHQEKERDKNLDDLAREAFKSLEDGDKENIKTWKICTEVSLKEFNKIYNLLNIKIDNCVGESFYQEKAKKIAADALGKNIAQKSQGALIVSIKDKAPLMLLKSDGATTYATRDLAAIKYRINLYNPDIILYEAGKEQSFAFEQLFATAKKFSWLNIKKTKLKYIGHGLYRAKDGKFSTRQGKTIHLEEVLKEGVELAKEIVKDKELALKEKTKISNIIGIGAIKYNDLSQHYSKDIIFDWDKILNLQGNSASYIQYTVVRCIGILEKNSVKYKNLNGFVDFLALEKSERALLIILLKYKEVLDEACVKFSPNLVANYIYKLAQDYSVFYENCPILVAEKNQTLRLSLTEATKEVLKSGLSLLGIKTVDRM